MADKCVQGRKGGGGAFQESKESQSIREIMIRTEKNEEK